MKLLAFGDVHRPTSDTWLGPELNNLCRKHDAVTANLEGPLGGVGEPLPKVGPPVAQHPYALAALQAAGVTFVSLANNHIMDFGPEALAATTTKLDDLGIAHTGAGETFTTAYAPHIETQDGVRLAHLSLAEWGFGAADAKTRGGFAWLNHSSVPKLIETTKAKVDILIVHAHAGAEGVTAPLPEWREGYRRLLELGADVIIGHHPHCVQGVEEYRGKYIFYSLGNATRVNTTTGPIDGAALSLTLTQSGVTDYTLYPLIVAPDGTTELDPRPEAIETIAARTTALGNTYEQAVDELVLKLWHERTRYHFERSFGGYQSPRQFLRSLRDHLRGAPIDYRLLSHNLNIESHRFVAARAARLLSEKN